MSHPMSTAYQDRPVMDRPAPPVVQAIITLSEIVEQLERALGDHRGRLSPVLNHAVTEAQCGNEKERTTGSPDLRLSASIECLIKRVSMVVDGIRSLDDRLEI